MAAKTEGTAREQLGKLILQESRVISSRTKLWSMDRDAFEGALVWQTLQHLLPADGSFPAQARRCLDDPHELAAFMRWKVSSVFSHPPPGGHERTPRRPPSDADPRGPPDTFTRPDVNATIRERNDIINEAVDRLPDEQKVVVRGHMDGKSFSKIGEELGIKKQSAHQRFREAVKQVRETLRKAGFDP